MFHVLGAIGSIFYPKGEEAKENSVETSVPKSPKEETKALNDEDDSLADFGEYPLATVTELMLFPCRGAKGFSIKKAKITMTGFELDRQWFVLDRIYDNTIDPAVDKRMVSLTKNDEIGVVELEFREKNGQRLLAFTHPDMKDELVVDVNNPPTNDPYIFYNTYGE